MKKWIVSFVEILGYAAYTVFIIKLVPEKLENVSLQWLFLLPIIAFVVINLLQILLESSRLKKRLIDRHDKTGPWRFQTILFAVICLVFLVAFYCLEHLAHMPASPGLLVTISLMSTCIHLFICRILGIIFSGESIFSEDYEEQDR